MASTGIYTTLLQNSGFTDEQWSREVMLKADAQNVMASRVTVLTARQGSKIHVPKLSTFDAAGTITRGASGTEGASNTDYTTISDTDAEIQPVTAYSKIQIPITVEAELLNGDRAPIWEQAIQTRMGQSLGKKEEITLLSEYSNSTQTAINSGASGYHNMLWSGDGIALGRWLGMRTKEQWDSDTDSTKLGMYMDFGTKTIWGDYLVDYIVPAGDAITWDNFLASVTLLENANAPKPYYWAVHSSLYGQLFKIPEFWEASKVGDSGAAPGRSGTGLRPLGVEILVTSNVVNA